MGRIFKDRKITASGMLLPFEEFRLFSDMESPEIVPEKAKILIEQAEKLLDEPIPFIPLSTYREFWKSGNRSAFQSLYYKRIDALYPMIFAEHIEKQGRFIDKIADLVWAILEETTWVIHAHSSHTPMNEGSEVPVVYRDSDIDGVDLFSATTGAILTAALLYCREGLNKISPIISERIEHELKRRIIKPFLTVIFTWSGSYGSRPNNWCPWIVSNVLFITAVIEKDKRTREAVVNRSMAYLDNYIAGQPEDGGCDEGPGYWSAAGGCMFDAIELLYDMSGGKINVFDDEHLRKMGEYEMFANIHADRYVNFGDTSPRMIPDGFLLTRFGKRCGSEALETFGKTITTKCAPYGGNRHTYRSIKDMMMSSVEDAIAPKSPTKGYLPSLKLMIARESEDTGKGFFVACKGGHNKESHNHNDVGQFIIYKDGEPVVIDPGTVTYTRDTFGSRRYTIWAMQSHYHNLPAFDGFGEHQGPEFKSTREAYDEESGKISYGLEEAYEKAAGVKEYTRSAVIENGCVIIEEDIKLDCEREIDFRIMLHREPTLIGAGKIQLTEGVVLEYDTSLEYECEIFDPVGADTEKRWETPVLYRMHFKKMAAEVNCKFVFSK